MSDTVSVQPATTAPEDDKPAGVTDMSATVGGASETTPTVAANEIAPAIAAADVSTPPVDAPVEPTSNPKENDVATTNGPVPKKEKRKSGATVPEHKNKKLNRKKSMPNLHLNAQPGEYWYVSMKGYPPWPAIICDEAMLPESLLSKRPVSAMRPDGLYREDFMEGGKNVRDRRYPVMFLGTNEFAWQVNTEILPLDMDELKQMVAANDQGKRSKQLWRAYEVAAEENDLDYFKTMLVDHEKEVIKQRQEQEDKEAKKQEDQVKKARRQSGVPADVDAEMEEAGSDAPKKPKKSNKRKVPKEGETDGDIAPPTKIIKKLKIKAPASPPEEAAPKPKKPRAKKAAKTEAEPAIATPKVEETLTPSERLEKKQKTILYLRHKLQKGFLSRDQAPKEEEMPQMSEHLTQLEAYTDLEAGIIRLTKINKVLKGIVRLTSIPREAEFTFKKRSEDLLTLWNKSLTTNGDSAPAAGEDVVTNGVAHGEKPASEGKPAEDQAMAEATDAPKPSEATSEEAKEAKDVTMEDAPAATEPSEAPAPDSAAVIA